MDRRAFLARSATALAMLGASGCRAFSGREKGHADPMWFMPDEAHRHRRTWMAFGPRGDIWGDALLPSVRANLALIARTIARYEPVSMLVRPEDRPLAASLCGASVELVDAALDDLWIRDTGPTFVIDETGGLGALDLNFNGWGEKQDYENDAAVARLVARLAGATRLETALVGEGGGIEVDGRGTAIVTESCLLNRNRNPGIDKRAAERLLCKALGLRKIIWLPGVRGEDITDGHTDFYARFAGPGVVLATLDVDPESFDYEVTREHLKILRKAQDADGQNLEVVTLESPRTIRRDYETEEFAAGYINYYVINGAVIAPEFGDERADRRCRDVLRRCFPDRDVVQLDIDAIAAGGGGIHCATQQEPARAS